MTYYNIVIALAIGLFCTAAASRAAEEPSRSIVTTIAGDGRIGVADGAALQSHFVLPVGVSANADGSVLVVDAGDNAIYRLKNAAVERIAGAKLTIHESSGAPGGYKNGPAAGALFDRPTAAIQSSDGTIYVADSGNHCIRIIANGAVGTYAGSRMPGNKDGERQAAEFANPNGLAFAADGALLVSDFGNGIRHIGKDGTVTTLPFGNGKVFGIATARMEGHDIVAFTDRDAIHLVTDGKDQTLLASQNRMPTNDGVPIFHGWGIAIINENTVVVSDVFTSVIRLVRFPSLPYTYMPASEALSGGLHEDTDFHGGFRDGTSAVALYDVPRGIALDARGRLVIADSGNRRIRLLQGFNARETVLPDFSNFILRPNASNLVMIGQSTLFNGVLWSDSIPGSAEATLATAASTDGIERPVHIEAIRTDAATSHVLFDLADTYVVDRGSIDAIAFFFSEYSFPSVDELVVEANALAAHNIKTIAVLVPEEDTSYIGEFPYSACACIVDAGKIDDDRKRMQALVASYREAGIQVVSLIEAIDEAERNKAFGALFDMADIHYTPFGQRLIGGTFAKALVADRRWLAKGAPTFTSPLLKPVRCDRLPVDFSAATVGLMDPLSTGTSVVRVLATGDVIAPADVIHFTGWAFSTAKSTPDRHVCPVVDGYTGIAFTGEEDVFRGDVATAFKNPLAERSGFDIRLDAGHLTPGPHEIGTAVILSDGKAYPIGKVIDIVVKK